MRRRALLASLSATLATAGCMGSGPSESGQVPAGETDEQPRTTDALGSRDATTAESVDTTTARSATATVRSTTTRPAMEPGQIRARGEPVSISRTVSDDDGWDDNKRYFPANGTVRVALAKSGEEVLRTKDYSFEEWVAFEAPEYASERAVAVTAERTGESGFGSAISAPPESVDVPLVVTVRVTYDNEDGRLVDPPEMALERLADAAPRSVEVTLSMGDRSHTATVPVFAAREPEAEPLGIGDYSTMRGPTR